MQNKTIFYIVLAFEVLTIIFTASGLIPREANLIMTGIMAFYFIFNRIEDSLILFVLSIPLFVALPITDNFDTMANWRILLVILFVVWFFKKYRWTQIRELVFKNSRLTKLVALFLLVGVLSLIVATNIGVGIKKLLFLINIFLLFPIVKDVAKDKNQKKKLIIVGAAAVIVSLVVGYSQVVFTIVKPLYTFWQWWANNVISVFYGNNLSELVKTSNTWFSYYPDGPPTLRMFSVFPDSHSFALFAIIGLIFFVYLLKEKKSFWILIVLSFLALIFSGSRAVWLSAIIPFLAAVFLLIFKKQKIFKPFIIMLVIFALSFPVSSFIMAKSYRGGDGTLAFKRAKSIADLEELSVKSRMGIWKTSLKSVLKHPILGVGIGNYPVVLGEEISAAKKGASAHNLYLDIASEMGLLGLIALLLIFLEILKTCWKKFKIDNYAFVFLFFFVWILIYNLFDVVLLNDKVLLLFMAGLAILYTDEQISINQHSDI